MHPTRWRPADRRGRTGTATGRRGRSRDGGYRPGPYRHFRITDPKPRLISAAPFRDRVVHHALVQVLEPIFDRGFIHDSYACRRGKGTHRAIARARGYLCRHTHLLKTDIVKFFPNVDHAVLRAVIARRIADPSVLALTDEILASGAGVAGRCGARQCRRNHQAAAASASVR